LPRHQNSETPTTRIVAVVLAQALRSRKHFDRYLDMAPPVLIMCRGVEMSVARDVLHKSPVLLNAAEGTEEVVELDRDPAAVRLILDYCSSGIITQKKKRHSSWR
jgi:hypothetical protein